MSDLEESLKRQMQTETRQQKKSAAVQKAAYLKQYDRPGFLGNIVKMDIDTFKEEAFDLQNKGKPLKRR